MFVGRLVIAPINHLLLLSSRCNCVRVNLRINYLPRSVVVDDVAVVVCVEFSMVRFSAKPPVLT